MHTLRGCKTAAEVYEEPQLARKTQAVRNIIGAGMTAMGLASLVRLARYGLADQSPYAEPHAQASIPESVPVYIPWFRPHKKEDEKRAAYLQKLAGALTAPLDIALKPLEQRIAPLLPDIHTSNPVATWWGVPAIAAMTLGGGGLGWHLTDKAVKAHADSQLNTDLDDARREYEHTLREDYRAALQEKGANALGRELDAFYDVLTQGVETTKAAGVATDTLNGLGGAYLTALLGAGGLGAYSGYKWTKSRSDAERITSALRARAFSRDSPQPLYAVAHSQAGAPGITDEDSDLDDAGMLAQVLSLRDPR